MTVFTQNTKYFPFDSAFVMLSQGPRFARKYLGHRSLAAFLPQICSKMAAFKFHSNFQDNAYSSFTYDLYGSNHL